MGWGGGKVTFHVQYSWQLTVDSWQLAPRHSSLNFLDGSYLCTESLIVNKSANFPPWTVRKKFLVANSIIWPTSSLLSPKGIVLRPRERSLFVARSFANSTASISWRSWAAGGPEEVAASVEARRVSRAFRLSWRLSQSFRLSSVLSSRASMSSST